MSSVIEDRRRSTKIILSPPAMSKEAQLLIASMTKDDTKILGKWLERKREQSQPTDKFHTSKFKTHNSNWTPMVHRPSNEQIFKERMDLIANWFDMWTDSQRRRFLDLVLTHSARAQLTHIHSWFTERVPLRHVDMTAVLPRFLSIYILSFLDPRSLCRASTVSWHWKFLAEQDVLWEPKCARQGWFLPYTPSEWEYGAWKRHYLACTKTLDVDIRRLTTSRASTMRKSKKGACELDKQRKSTENMFAKTTNKTKTNKTVSQYPDTTVAVRPMWLPPDRAPRDLELAQIALLADRNRNDPKLHPSTLLFHDKFGFPRDQSMRNHSAPNFSSVLPFGRKNIETEGDEFDGLYYQDGVDNEEENVGTSTRPLSAPGRPTYVSPEMFRSQRGTRGTGLPLSHSLDLESFEERRLMELVGMTSEPPLPRRHVSKRRPDLSGGAGYPALGTSIHLAMNQSPIANNVQMEEQSCLRVIFISSRVPAAEVLLDAVLFGVIPIAYEYEGTTCESLLHQLEDRLKGRMARSVAVVTDCLRGAMDAIRLTLNATLTADNVDDSAEPFAQFFETVASHVVRAEDGGHIDLFVPLHSTDAGMELVARLTRLTGIPITCLTGHINGYDYGGGEWSMMPEGGSSSPPELYFCSSKLLAWSASCERAVAACHFIRELAGKFGDRLKCDVIAQIVGQVIFDASGEVSLHGAREISQALIRGLLHVGNQPVNRPVEALARFLLNDCGVEDKTGINKTNRTKAAIPRYHDHNDMAEEDEEEYDEEEGQQEEKEELEEDGGYMDEEKVEGEKRDRDEKDSGVVCRDSAGGRSRDGTMSGSDFSSRPPSAFSVPPSARSSGRSRPSTASLAQTQQTCSTTKPSHSTYLPPSSSSSGKSCKSQMISASSTPQWTKSSKRTLVAVLPSSVDRRLSLAHELLATEQAYFRTLQMVDKAFYSPFTAALSSNRAIISAHNVDAIFTDIIRLLQLSSELVSDLQLRLTAEWETGHECIGDVFVSFAAKLQAYVDFVKNYPRVLATIEKCTEQSMAFRAFLSHRERTPTTKMLTLPELFITPMRRVHEYVTLLMSLQRHTSRDHVDRDAVDGALRSFVQLEKLIQQSRLRYERDSRLKEIQKSVVNCPVLEEGNRFFITQLDVTGLEPPVESVLPELRVYRQKEALGLILFNDALVVTRRTTQFVPFEFYVNQTYTFITCTSLARLRVTDIADSKFVSNAFRLFTPRQEWICSADTAQDKLKWISTLEEIIRAASADDTN